MQKQLRVAGTSLALSATSYMHSLQQCQQRTVVLLQRDSTYILHDQKQA
jgi:hypothetical protein